MYLSKTLLCTLFLLSVSGQAYSDSSSEPTPKTDGEELYKDISLDLPKVGADAEVYMGDQLLKQRSGRFVECIVPNFEVEAKKLGGWTLLVKQGVPVCKKFESDKYFTAPYVNGIHKSGNTHDYLISLKEKKGKYRFCLSISGLNGHCEKKLTLDDFESTTSFVTEPDSFQRTIEYSGKRGGVLKFVYSEFKNGLARDAFTREFEADLAEGNTIAYKGAVIEVIDANNASIKYKVIRHFRE